MIALGVRLLRTTIRITLKAMLMIVSLMEAIISRMLVVSWLIMMSSSFISYIGEQFYHAYKMTGSTIRTRSGWCTERWSSIVTAIEGSLRMKGEMSYVEAKSWLPGGAGRAVPEEYISLGSIYRSITNVPDYEIPDYDIDYPAATSCPKDCISCWWTKQLVHNKYLVSKLSLPV
jgi:hypothetical protein